MLADERPEGARIAGGAIGACEGPVTAWAKASLAWGPVESKGMDRLSEMQTNRRMERLRENLGGIDSI
jgi:hypothetical protein